LRQQLDRLIGFFLIGEPDERAVIGNVEGFERAEQSAGLAVTDVVVLRALDGRLPVLGTDDD
jgi:hypothetical protein